MTINHIARDIDELERQLNTTTDTLSAELSALDFKNASKWSSDLADLINRLNALRDYHEAWQAAETARHRLKPPLSELF